MNTVLQQARSVMETSGSVIGTGIPADISLSWKRCLELGLDPRSDSPDCVLTVQELYARKQIHQHLLSIARPEMEFLSDQIAGSNFLIAFGDADGAVLDVVTDVQAEGSPEAKAILPGSVWREELRGTNALGLSAKLGKPMIVTGSEHFFSSNSAITCISAPVFKSDGSIAGILNATSPVSDRDRHTASLVNLAALNISNRLFIEEHRKELIVLCHPRQEYLATQSAGLLAFDQYGQLTGATARARNILPDIVSLKRPHFCDVFQNGYSDAFGSLHTGETALLRDCKGSHVFLRIRPTRGLLTGTREPAQKMVVSVPAVHISDGQTGTRTTGAGTTDGLIAQQIGVCAETINACLPVRICGRSGSGLSETARAVANRIKGQNRCIEVDCSLAKVSQLEVWLGGQIVEGSDQVFRPPLETPGTVTLILDGIEALGEQALPVAKRLLSHLNRRSREHEGLSHCALIATERKSGKIECREEPEFLGMNDFWGHSFFVPPLSERQDLAVIANDILGEFAPGVGLDNDAISLIRQIGEHLTFYTLRRMLFQLSRRGKVEQIDVARIRELLPWLTENEAVCPDCQNHHAREANCRRIRITLRACDGNVSLAARRLGMSRNTIYKHTGRN